VLCRACGDRLSDDLKSRAKWLDFRGGDQLVEGELRFCRECADEIFRNKIQNNNLSSFGGRSGPRDDASPGQENAIRNLEERDA